MANETIWIPNLVGEFIIDDQEAQVHEDFAQLCNKFINSSDNSCTTLQCYGHDGRAAVVKFTKYNSVDNWTEPTIDFNSYFTEGNHTSLVSVLKGTKPSGSNYKSFFPDYPQYISYGYIEYTTEGVKVYKTDSNFKNADLKATLNQTYTADGVTVYNVPPKAIILKLWGGSGGGGGNNRKNIGGAGGGGGSFCACIWKFHHFNEKAYFQIGSGGAGGKGANNENGKDGGDTSVFNENKTAIITAGGGKGGERGVPSTAKSNTGGAGGRYDYSDATNNTIYNYTGQHGGNGGGCVGKTPSDGTGADAIKVYYTKIEDDRKLAGNSISYVKANGGKNGGTWGGGGGGAQGAAAIVPGASYTSGDGAKGGKEGESAERNYIGGGGGGAGGDPGNNDGSDGGNGELTISY